MTPTTQSTYGMTKPLSNELQQFLGSLKECSQSPSNFCLWYAVCPQCGKKNFAIRVDTGFYWCWRGKCGYRGYIKSLGGSGREPLLKIEDWDPMGAYVNPFSYEYPTPLSYQDREGMMLIEHHHYLKHRGFDIWDFIQYPIAVTHKLPGYILFLIKSEGDFIGYVARYAGMDDEKLKYLNMKGLQLSGMLYGIDNLYVNSVVLTEGILSAINVNTHLQNLGIFDINAVATFGSKISKQQVYLLRQKNVRKVFFWHEQDSEITRNRYYKNGRMLSRHFDVYKESFILSDPGDIGEEEVKNKITHRELWNSMVGLNVEF